MKQLAELFTVLAVLAFLGLPANAQFYGQQMPSVSDKRDSVIDPLNQYSSSGMGFDSTLEFLQRKSEEQRKRREREERQRRIGENIISIVPEQLLDSYFSRRSRAPSNRR